MIGPPESPEQESLPPAAYPAHHMLVVTADVPYSAWQEAREMTGTETFLKVDGNVDPFSVKRPLFTISAFSSNKIC